MKKFPYLVLLCFAFVINGCSDSDEATPLSSDKQIVSFQFLASDNPQLDENVVGVIDHDARRITAFVYEEDDLMLLPTIAIHAAATISPGGRHDFSEAVTYTVTAEDGSSVDYEVVVETPYHVRQQQKLILLRFQEANPDSELTWSENDEITEWEEVELNEEGYVVGIALPNMGLAVVPEEIGLLTRLETLDLSENTFETLPGTIGDLVSLKYLNLGNSALKALPETIGDLAALEKFIIQSSSEEFTSLPGEIGQLNSLSYLSIRTSPGLASLPQEIGQLQNLDTLYVITNAALTTLPEEIGQLSDLKYMYISNNDNLTALPESIGNLSMLRDLLITRNDNLTSIPATIGQLSQLVVLNLYDNDLQSVPAELGQLGNLSLLRITSNPDLTELPIEVCFLIDEDTELHFDEGATLCP